MTMQVLIIDSDFSVSEDTRNLLLQSNVELTHVISSKKGIELLNKTHYNFLLLSYGSPDIDGFELAKEVRQMESYKETPIAMLSEECSRTLATAGRRLGIKAWLTKPVQQVVFIMTIKKMLKIG